MSTENKNDKNTPSKVKHTALYYIAAIVCACILTTAILLVVFLPGPQKNVIENPSEVPPVSTPITPPAEDKPVVADKTTFVMPVVNGEVIQDFKFWHNATTDVYKLHKGIDFKAAAGTEVHAVLAGTVEFARRDTATGGRVVIDHGNGIKTIYMSIDIAENIKEGGKVERNAVIGTISSDIDCMGDEKDLGAHLHFEVLELNTKTNKYENVDPNKHLVLSEK